MDRSISRDVVAKVREWYEKNRESWFSRMNVSPDAIDTFIEALIIEVQHEITLAAPAPAPVGILDVQVPRQRGPGKKRR